jgi:hypothetical protein
MHATHWLDTNCEKHVPTLLSDVVAADGSGYALYTASKPLAWVDESDVSTRSIDPLSEMTGSGSSEPVSSANRVEPSYTRRKSNPRSRSKRVNSSETLFAPSGAICHEQIASSW